MDNSVSIRIITNFKYSCEKTIGPCNQNMVISTSVEKPQGIIIIMDSLTKYDLIATQKIRFQLENASDKPIPCILVIQTTNYTVRQVIFMKESTTLDEVFIPVMKIINVQEWLYGTGNTESDIDYCLGQLATMIQGQTYIEKMELGMQKALIQGFENWPETNWDISSTKNYMDFFFNMIKTNDSPTYPITHFKKIIINWTWVDREYYSIKENDVNFILDQVKKCLSGENGENSCHVFEQDIGTISLSISQIKSTKKVLFPLIVKEDRPQVTNNRFDIDYGGRSLSNGKQVGKAWKYGTVSIICASDSSSDYSAKSSKHIDNIINSIKKEIMIGVQLKNLTQDVTSNQIMTTAKSHMLISTNVTHKIEVSQQTPFIGVSFNK